MRKALLHFAAPKQCCRQRLRWRQPWASASCCCQWHCLGATKRRKASGCLRRAAIQVDQHDRQAQHCALLTSQLVGRTRLPAQPWHTGHIPSHLLHCSSSLSLSPSWSASSVCASHAPRFGRHTSTVSCQHPTPWVTVRQRHASRRTWLTCRPAGRSLHVPPACLGGCHRPTLRHCPAWSPHATHLTHLLRHYWR